MAFLFGAALGLMLGVAVVMVFARLENARAEQRRELVRACRQSNGPIPGQLLIFLYWYVQFDFGVCRSVVWFVDSVICSR